MSPLAPGLLVAAPPLGDPNFDRSVVLLAVHGEEGAFGWVINGREMMTLPELLVRAEVTAEPPLLAGSVRLGGPVSPGQMWLIYRTDARLCGLEGQFEVCPGVTATASRQVLESVAAGQVPEGLMGFIGYAGWAPLQLENEIRSGAWLPIDIEPKLLFETPREQIWTRAYESAGTTPIAFTTRTVGLA